MKELKRHYFIDEAGDLTLFNKKKKVIIGDEGCSKYFILGVAHITEPHSVRKKLDILRTEILKDQYLINIPSVHKKTKVAFHAKDDCSEVRREVFKLINTIGVKVYLRIGCIQQKKTI